MDGLNRSGNFRPYIGALVGMSFFSERTVYDWGDDCSLFDIFLDIVFENTDFCNNNNSSTDINDRSWSPTFTLDIGTNIFFNKSQNVGMDLGVRYNMLTSLKRPDNILEVSGAVNEIADYFEADYYTLYIGIIWMIDSSKANRKHNKGKGKLI